MTTNYKNILLIGAALLIGAGPGCLQAQKFDTSGTSGLSGQYLFRYVVHFNDTSGNLTESCSLTGTVSFDGKGKYSLINTTLYDSNAGILDASGSPTNFCTSLGGGTYGVQSNGMMQMDNPFFPQTLFGAFSQPVITASSTEDDEFDMFVAVQAPQTPFSNNSLKGAYTLGSLEFPSVATQGTNLAHQAYFTLNADGNGGISPITLTGSAENLSSTVVTQAVSGATYTLSGVTGGTLTIPNSNTSQLVVGTKTIYISADGAFIVGGSTSGADMIFGFQAPTGASNSLLSGTYFTSGLDADVSSGFLDAFYGSINANGAGTLLWHERFDDIVDIFAYDNTFNSTVNIGSAGSYYDGSFTTLVGANGKAMMLIGSGQQFSLNIGVQAPSFTPTPGVWINPIGITNAANYSPITNAYAPGELVNIYGNFGVTTQVDQVIPVPTTLGGVQVLVNGLAAPVYLVSANQLSALIPYGIAGQYFATFQVVVNGAKSNTVTVYVDNSSPAIYTLTQNGIGSGAMLHSNYTAVTDSSPASPGETISLFMNGLGTVTPNVADGAAGPSSPLSNVDTNLAIYMDDFVDSLAQASVSFAGLAPGFPGLYQVNFTVPRRGLGNGHVYILFETVEGNTEMSTISLTGFTHKSGVADIPVQRSSIAKSKRGAAKRATPASRRALPGRIVEPN